MVDALLGPLAGAMGYMLVIGAPTFLILAYFFVVWDKRQADSPSADDTQIGLKLGLFFLAIIGLGMAVSGASMFLHYLLSGAKTGSFAIKTGIASILSGGIVVGGVWFVFLPRTNYNQYPKATRLTLGYISVVTGLVSAVSLNFFIIGLFNSASWRGNSVNFANLLIFGGLAVVALSRFGALSGWTAPPPRATGFQGGPGGFPQGGAPQGGFPQGGAPQGGFPQGGAPQGGFPQGGAPQGGFPQGGAPQGGFPQGGAPQGGAPQGGFPQGGAPQGGAPQQGGAAPAQSGGFPAPGGNPQGGGGLPPPSGSGGSGGSGGGFPPR